MRKSSLQARYALLGTELDLVENVTIHLEGSKIVGIDEERSIKSEHLLIPGFYNAHTHTGDSGLYGKLPTGKTLEELVGDDSIKQEYLKTLTPKKLDETLTQFASEGWNNHITLFNDFREDGLPGIEPYLHGNTSKYVNLLDVDSASGLPTVSVLGRPRNLDEAKQMAKYVGLGIRDIFFYPIDLMEEMVSVFQQQDRAVQIHVAEDGEKTRLWVEETGLTDVIWAAKELKAELLIHTNYATEADYEYLKANRVSISICPTSNQITKVPTVNLKLLDQIDFPVDQINLGTDNGMFQDNNIAKELILLNKMSNYSSQQLLQIAMVPSTISSVAHLSSISKGNNYRGQLIPWSHPTINYEQIYSRLTEPYVSSS